MIEWPTPHIFAAQHEQIEDVQHYRGRSAAEVQKILLEVWGTDAVPHTSARLSVAHLIRSMPSLVLGDRIGVRNRSLRPMYVRSGEHRAVRAR
jgi:hypothetical protein